MIATSSLPPFNQIPSTKFLQALTHLLETQHPKLGTPGPEPSEICSLSPSLLPLLVSLQLPSQVAHSHIYWRVYFFCWFDVLLCVCVCLSTAFDIFFVYVQKNCSTTWHVTHITWWTISAGDFPFFICSCNSWIFASRSCLHCFSACNQHEDQNMVSWSLHTTTWTQCNDNFDT